MKAAKCIVFADLCVVCCALEQQGLQSISAHTLLAQDEEVQGSAGTFRDIENSIMRKRTADWTLPQATHSQRATQILNKREAGMKTRKGKPLVSIHCEVEVLPPFTLEQIRVPGAVQ